MTSSRNTTIIFLIAVVSLASDLIASAILDTLRSLDILSALWPLYVAAVWRNFAQTSSDYSNTRHTSLSEPLSNAFSALSRKSTRPNPVKLADYAIQDRAPWYTPSYKDCVTLENQRAPKCPASPVILILCVGISSTRRAQPSTAKSPVDTGREHLLAKPPPTTHLPLVRSTAFPALPLPTAHGPARLPEFRLAPAFPLSLSQSPLHPKPNSLPAPLSFVSSMQPMKFPSLDVPSSRSETPPMEVDCTGPISPNLRSAAGPSFAASSFSPTYQPSRQTYAILGSVLSHPENLQQHAEEFYADLAALVATRPAFTSDLWEPMQAD
ncbi:hypothetical protein C8R44DRAFT_846609 [Mycena epipterygia]|nr:hypothetical protein C8R44DRAFT_846609 [Mycena epipterygia]